MSLLETADWHSADFSSEFKEALKVHSDKHFKVFGRGRGRRTMPIEHSSLGSMFSGSHNLSYTGSFHFTNKITVFLCDT
jgi:hypothetical protein